MRPEIDSASLSAAIRKVCGQANRTARPSSASTLVGQLRGWSSTSSRRLQREARERYHCPDKLKPYQDKILKRKTADTVKQ